MERDKILLIDIIPDHEPFNNCIEDIFSTLLKWRNRDITFIFSNSWSFSFKKIETTNTLLGYRVDIYRNGFKQLEDTLKEYYGIIVKWNKIANCNDILLFAAEEIEKGQPIGISLDAFWCPWNKGYNKYNALHYCLVTGIQNEQLVCVDSYLSSKRELLSLKDYCNCYNHYLTITFASTSNCYDWKTIIKDAVVKALGRDDFINDFDKMREFANEIKNYKNISNEFAGYDDVGFAPIIPKINSISYGRKNFAKILQYFYHRNYIAELNDFSNQLNEAGLKWSKINNLLLKYNALGFNEERLTNLYGKIMEIADCEENLAKNVLSFIE